MAVDPSEQAMRISSPGASDGAKYSFANFEEVGSHWRVCSKRISPFRTTWHFIVSEDGGTWGSI
jgi:hypothetical protein